MKWITFGTQEPSLPSLPPLFKVGATAEPQAFLPSAVPHPQKPLSLWVVGGIGIAGIATVGILCRMMEKSAERASRIG